MSITHQIKKNLRRLGYDIVKFKPWIHPVAQRKQLMESFKIDMVFDVGANTGDFGRELLDWGFSGKIMSFEPVKETFHHLEMSCSRAPNWSAFPFALGEMNGERTINLSKNTQSSSMLGIKEAHTASAPDSEYVSSEIIQIRTLDSLFPALTRNARNIFLKLDVQGFEKWVLQGAEESLSSILLLQLELPLTPLYEGESPYLEMFQYLLARNFELIGLETVFTHPQTGETLQFDAIFKNTALSHPKSLTPSTP
jgi:FkbM family methyltransferase